MAETKINETTQGKFVVLVALSILAAGAALWGFTTMVKPKIAGQ